MPRRLINQTSLKNKSQFISQLREEYHLKGTSLWDCFLMYLGFLDILGCEYLVERSVWQEEDYYTVIHNPKTMWHRNRRAGKTLGLSVLAVFFSIINFGYRANAGKVVWRAPASDQLSQAQEWLRQNPFVIWISGENDAYILDSKPIDMACLSAGKAASKGAAVMIEDEYRDVYKGLKMYDIAGRAEDMVAEGPNETRRMISASTGCRLTYFHDQFLGGEWEYCRHTWKECPWITADYVESKRREHPEDPYFVDQEFNAVWVARGDTAYRNVWIVDMEAKTVTNNENVYAFGDHPFFPEQWTFPEPRKAGVDFNGPKTGHYITIGSSDDQAHYINREYVVYSIPELKAYGKLYDMEIESGPLFNVEYAQECVANDIRCIHQIWDKPTLLERFYLSRSKIIVIDRRRASFTLGNLQEAVTDPAQRIEILKKSTTQHGLDGFLHQIHKTPMQAVVYKRPTFSMHNEAQQSNIF